MFLLIFFYFLVKYWIISTDNIRLKIIRSLLGKGKEENQAAVASVIFYVNL